MSSLTDDGAKKLAAAILGLAHEDYTGAKAKTIEDTNKIKSEAASARHFLHTDWCRDLCEMIDVDYQKFVEVTISKSHLAQPVYKYLEAEIRDYHRSVSEIEQIKRDVAECNHTETNKGGHSIAVGNPTVSIHAPARGATIQSVYVLGLDWFQSTRPRGARHRDIGKHARKVGFNPRARAGRDTLTGR